MACLLKDPKQFNGDREIHQAAGHAGQGNGRASWIECGAARDALRVVARARCWRKGRQL